MLLLSQPFEKTLNATPFNGFNVTHPLESAFYYQANSLKKINAIRFDTIKLSNKNRRIKVHISSVSSRFSNAMDTLNDLWLMFVMCKFFRASLKMLGVEEKFWRKKGNVFGRGAAYK